MVDESWHLIGGAETNWALERDRSEPGKAHRAPLTYIRGFAMHTLDVIDRVSHHNLRQRESALSLRLVGKNVDWRRTRGRLTHVTAE